MFAAVGCLQQVAKRPVSPHVFELDGKGTHYRFPVNAISSIMNRATGVVWSAGAPSWCSAHCIVPEFGLPLNPREASDTKSLAAGVTGVGLAALTVDLPSAVEALKSSTVLADAAKAVISFPLLYHYLGGVRHIYWDHANYGLQAEKKGPLTLSAVDRSSYAVLGASLVGTAGLALAWF